MITRYQKFLSDIKDANSVVLKLNLDLQYDCKGKFPLSIKIPRKSIDDIFSKTLEINKAFSDVISESSYLLNGTKEDPILVCSSTSDLFTVVAHDVHVIKFVFGIINNIYRI